MPAIHWFRNDLRLSDNPALLDAVGCGDVLPVYIWDTTDPKPIGGASRAWLHRSLQSLNADLGGRLVFRVGDPAVVLAELVQAHGVSAVYWNRGYDPHTIARDTHIKHILKSQNVTPNSHNGSLLWEPWDIKNGSGVPYRVFTPYYNRGCANAEPPRLPYPAPATNRWYTGAVDCGDIGDLPLLPKNPTTPDWHTPMMAHWNTGEQGAMQTLKFFAKQALAGYQGGRDYPAQQAVSTLSPHLHFGELSPHQVWHGVREFAPKSTPQTAIDAYCRQLGWREFCHSLLYHNPQTVTDNLNSAFDNFAWQWNDTPQNAENYRRWCRGQTGYPLVDAGMRELWATGIMHNRVRMVVGSFLVKNLLLHWRLGEQWFWDTLVDADHANNTAGWQWIAGCGADASPYYRIFNPITQGEKFDGAGEYTKKWVPELKNMPPKYLFKPWDAPWNVLDTAGVALGDTYPHPIVDLAQSRKRALSALQDSKHP